MLNKRAKISKTNMKKGGMRFPTRVATAMAIVGTVMSTMGMTVMAAENDAPAAVETQTETETQSPETTYKPILDENRARWIYYEMNDGYGEPEEVTPTETELQETPEVAADTTEKEIKLHHLPDDNDLKKMDLYDLVRNKKAGWMDTFYDTYRGDGEWRQVGSRDMIKFVRRTLGEDDPRYQALVAYCTHYEYSPRIRG